MNPRLRIFPAALVLGMALGLATTPVLAKKDGDGHGKGKEKHGKHFNHEKRAQVVSYYEGEFRSGHCPPGLAKKDNGCMPPGQAKKWRMGRPLAQSVVVYEVPPALVVRLGTPPAGYRYVRCDADILLISIRSRVVADVIVDLGRG